MAELLFAIIGALKEEGFVDVKMIDGEMHIILKMKEKTHDL